MHDEYSYQKQFNECKKITEYSDQEEIKPPTVEITLKSGPEPISFGAWIPHSCSLTPGEGPFTFAH